MTSQTGPSSALRWQVVIWRDGENLWGEPEALLEKFHKANCAYKCYAEHEGRKSGRKHYHCYMRFKTARQRQQMNKLFGANVRHMNGDDFDNAKYISEDGANKTFCEEGTKKRHNEQNAAVTVDTLLKSGQSIRDIIKDHVELRAYINQNKWVLQSVEEEYARDRYKADYVGINKPYDWQQHVLDQLGEPIHPRHILWYFDAEGDIGKSSLADELSVKHGVMKWNPAGKDTSGVAYNFAKKAKRERPSTIVADIKKEDYKHIQWSVVEASKDGHVESEKYDGIEWRDKRPRSIIFSNDNPTGCALTKNRVRLFTVKDNQVTGDDII